MTCLILFFQVKVNGPELKDKKTNIIIKHATAAYFKKRKRRKIPNLHKEVVNLSDDNQTKQYTFYVRILLVLILIQNLNWTL